MALSKPPSLGRHRLSMSEEESVMKLAVAITTIDAYLERTNAVKYYDGSAAVFGTTLLLGNEEMKHFDDSSANLRILLVVTAVSRMK
jgi:hypothetical protein